MCVFSVISNWYAELARPYDESDFIRHEDNETVNVKDVDSVDLSNVTPFPFIPNSVNLWWQELVKPYDESEFIRMDNFLELDKKSTSSNEEYMRQVNDMAEHNSQVSHRSRSTYIFMACSRWY